MKIFFNIKSAILKYIATFKIARIKKTNYFFVIFLTILTVFLDTIGIGILLPIGEYILNYESGKLPDTYSWKILKKVFLTLGIKPDITLLVIFAIIIITLRQVIVFFRALIIDTIRYKAVKDFRARLFEKFLKQDLYFSKKYNTGLYNNTINLEADNVGKAIVLPLQNISGLILIFSYLSLMMVATVKGTLIVIICMIFIGLFLKNILYKIQKIAGNIIKINNKFSQNLVDRLIAIRLIRVNNKTKREEKNNKEILQEQFVNNIKLTKIQRLIDSAIEPVLIMVTIPVIVIAVELGFSLAKLGVFVILLARFIPVFKVTVVSMQGHFSYYASIKNMLTLLDTLNNQKEIRQGKMEAPKYIKQIKFHNIYFGYDQIKSAILNNFSCSIEGKKVNAIIGDSGVGKTTLVNMIPRLLEPTKGEIFINNLNIKKINVSSLRNICSYIEQKPSFIRGSIIKHIAYNNLRVNKTKVLESAKLANAHKFIMGLKNNYNHKLGESGVGLSGGQLQRLDIARGISSGKPLMILDEPTSNLDKKNTLELLLTLRKINELKKTTIIIVSHDNNVLKFCDNIIKM
tara:strand:- start:2844 stop:4562 length:1719 start_codon:yes stop_codon:yes gene_type:complete